jgi:tRNA (cytidine/uridine-2'-O-)-methyltransferase
MHIVLVEPEIPGNTGNIARLCAATGCHLHLVRPFGFSLDDRYLKRAGLDYWHLLDVHYYDSVYEVLAQYPNNPKFLLTSHAHKSYTRVKYGPESLLIFGRESDGLPEKFRTEFAEDCVRIPMVKEARCLNLANSAAIVLYEALRQNNFDREEGTI